MPRARPVRRRPVADQPRPSYPSDEARRLIKPHVRVHHSVTNHPRMVEVWQNNDLLACWLRVLLFASRQGAAHTGDVLHLPDRQLGEVSGRSRRGAGRASLVRLAGLLGWTLVRTEGHPITQIHIRNFAKRQNITPRRDGVTPHDSAASSLLSPLSSPKEERIEPTALVPVGTSESEIASAPKDENLTPEDLVEAWNTTAKPRGLSLVREIRGSRLKKTRLRINEHPAAEFWEAVFTGLARSKFLIGSNGDRKGPHAAWRASFDWLMDNDVNATKVAEGRYA